MIEKYKCPPDAKPKGVPGCIHVYALKYYQNGGYTNHMPVRATKKLDLRFAVNSLILTLNL